MADWLFAKRRAVAIIKAILLAKAQRVARNTATFYFPHCRERKV